MPDATEFVTNLFSFLKKEVLRWTRTSKARRTAAILLFFGGVPILFCSKNLHADKKIPPHIRDDYAGEVL